MEFTRRASFSLIKMSELFSLGRQYREAQTLSFFKLAMPTGSLLKKRDTMKNSPTRILKRHIMTYDALLKSIVKCDRGQGSIFVLE